MYMYMCVVTHVSGAMGFRKTTSRARKDVQLIFEW